MTNNNFLEKQINFINVFIEKKFYFIFFNLEVFKFQKTYFEVCELFHTCLMQSIINFETILESENKNEFQQIYDLFYEMIDFELFSFYRSQYIKANELRTLFHIQNMFNDSNKDISLLLDNVCLTMLEKHSFEYEKSKSEFCSYQIRNFHEVYFRYFDIEY